MTFVDTRKTTFVGDARWFREIKTTKKYLAATATKSLCCLGLFRGNLQNTSAPRAIVTLLAFGLLNRVARLVHKSLRPHNFEGIVNRIERRLRRPVRTEVSVGPGKVLSVVDGEVHVVQRVMRGAVDELLRPMARNHVAIVDEDGPDLDTNKEDQVQISLHWANENKDAFWC
jgi:hypothetical protein